MGWALQTAQDHYRLIGRPVTALIAPSESWTTADGYTPIPAFHLLWLIMIALPFLKNYPENNGQNGLWHDQGAQDSFHLVKTLFLCQQKPPKMENQSASFTRIKIQNILIIHVYIYTVASQSTNACTYSGIKPFLCCIWSGSKSQTINKLKVPCEAYDEWKHYGGMFLQVGQHFVCVMNMHEITTRHTFLLQV